MDEQLVAIARAAEAGLECPPERVLLGSLVAWGVPAAWSEFAETSEEELVAQYEWGLRDRPRSERKADPTDAGELARAHLSNVRWSKDRDEPIALTLVEVTMWPVAGGDALELPALRVPFEAVDAWWVAGGTPVKRKPGTTWFFGLEEFLPKS